MANRFHQILQVVIKSYSCKTHLIKTTCNCWGSNQKVRNSPKLLGFSASIALFGFGIHNLENNEDENCSRSTSLLFDKRRKPDAALEQPLSVNPNIFRGIEEHKNGTSILNRGLSSAHNQQYKKDIQPPFRFYRLFGLLNILTPVSCSGEDSICNCNSISNCNCNSSQHEHPGIKFGSGDCTGSGQSKSNDFYDKTRQPSVNNACNCNNNAGYHNKTNSKTGHNVSNKPCHSGSHSSCSSSDVDIEALAAEMGGLKQVDWVVESDLSHCHLIRQASQVTVDSVTRILTETVSAYEDYHIEYRRLLDVMMNTLEESRKACGSELEMIDCKLILIRAKLDEMKHRIQELDMFLSNLDKLGFASAETAFMAHAEYASIAMSERMHSVNIEVKRLREETFDKERDMLELQALIIVETGKSLK